MSLKDYTEQELLAEIQRRKNEEQQRALEKRQKQFQILIKNRETLLSLIEHDRTSCSDHNKINGFGSGENGPRCSRCALLQLDQGDYIGYEFTLSLQFTRAAE